MESLIEDRKLSTTHQHHYHQHQQHQQQSKKFTLLIISLIITIIIQETVTTIVVSASTIQSSNNNNDNNNQLQFEKRQPIPMPRIGRSDDKRQSIIPAPRIGRRNEKRADNNGGGGDGQHQTSSIDCSLNPELCENYETVMMSNNGAGSGGGGGGNEQENLIEPLDIQLRAAFIPRLGKRSISSSSSSSLSPSSLHQRFQPQLNDLIDLYHSDYLSPRHSTSSNTDDDNDYYDDMNSNNVNNNEINQFQPQQQQQQPIKSSLKQMASIRDYFDQLQQQPPTTLNELINRYYLYQNNKRGAAIPYTPRIGRAVFAPRIGKKAAFVPRIG